VAPPGSITVILTVPWEDWAQTLGAANATRVAAAKNDLPTLLKTGSILLIDVMQDPPK
jgi:hypothetical protein